MVHCIIWNDSKKAIEYDTQSYVAVCALTPEIKKRCIKIPKLV